jgi:hypothetical protein
VLRFSQDEGILHPSKRKPQRTTYHNWKGTMSKPIDIVGNDIMGDYLARKWLAAKQAERDAAAHRIAVEEEILKVFPAREEGSETVTTHSGLKIRTTGKVTYKADLNALKQATLSWPVELSPVRVKEEADEALLKAIRAERPDLWRVIAPAITVKPAKTGVQVEQP